MNNVEEVIHTHTHTEYYTAMGGFMDEVLSVAYYAEHPGDDPSPAEVPPLATLMLFPLHPPPLPLSLFCCCCRFFSASSFLSLAPAGHADNASLQKRKKGEKERRKRNRDGPGHLMYGFGPIAQWLAQPKMIPRRGKRKLES